MSVCLPTGFGLLAGTPFVLDHLRGPEKSSASVVVCLSAYALWLHVIASNSTHSLRQKLQFFIIGLTHARAKCARLSFLSGARHVKETGYEAMLPLS